MVYAKALSIIVLVGLACSVAGCFSSHPADISAYMKPHQINVTATNYILQPPDEVEVHCAKVPELHDRRQRIRPDGKVSFEGIGEIQAAGRTCEQVVEEMKQKIAALYTLVGDKPIDVQLVAYQSKYYYVLGQVHLYGPKVYTGRDTVLDAVAWAQPNPMAWVERIQVIRPAKDETGKAKIFEVNFDRLAAHGDTSKNVLLEEGDIVYVPATVLSAMAMKVEEVIRPIARAFSGVNIVQYSRYGGGGYGGTRY